MIKEKAENTIGRRAFVLNCEWLRFLVEVEERKEEGHLHSQCPAVYLPNYTPNVLMRVPNLTTR